MNLGFSEELRSLLVRQSAVRKSSNNYSSETRPTVDEHVNSLSVLSQIFTPEKIILVDDVLTLGRTAMACENKILELYPNCEVISFSMVRTQGFIPNIENIADPSIGTIEPRPGGRTWRDP